MNWANFYGDLETDYYNGLNFHLDRIYWLEDQCEKLKSSNQYFKDLAKQKRQAPALQENSAKLNDLLKEYKNKLKVKKQNWLKRTRRGPT